MVGSQFDSILKELELYFNCTLNSQTDSCLIHMGIGIDIQIEIDSYGMLLIGSKLGPLESSRLRDIMIKAALQCNEVELPSTGVFGFSHKSNQLILFVKFDPQRMDNQQILSRLPAFIEKSKKWKDAIASGEPPPITSQVAPKSFGLFGIVS